MNHSIVRWLKSIFVGASITAHGQHNEIIQLNDSTQLIRITDFVSQYVDSRNIDILLPKNYDASDTSKIYNVLYWHDGQNLFDPIIAYNHNPLMMQSAIINAGMQDDYIIVAIWNTKKRYREYLPNKIYNYLSKAIRTGLKLEYSGRPIADDYIRFIGDELVPFIKSKYACSKNYIGGTSMGGLISFYAVIELSSIFDGAVCMSTHWPMSVRMNNHNTIVAIEKYLNENIQRLEGKKLYFDYGTENLDSWYEFYQLKINATLSSNSKINFMSKKYEGHSHSELDWKRRLSTTLKDLLEL